MFAVIFEVQPKPERFDDYLALAKTLKPKLEAIDGFIDNERFRSKRVEGRLLSLSTWRDEKAVIRWRTQGVHHQAQEKGRFEIFQDYHLRIGNVTSDTSPPKGAPILERRLDETEVGKAKFVTFTEITPRKGAAFASQADLLPAHLGLDLKARDVVDHDVWASIYNPGKMSLLVSWTDARAADSWTPRKIDGIENLRHRKVRIVRDYGRFDRREAPQFYPDVKGRETQHAAPVRKADAAAS